MAVRPSMQYIIDFVHTLIDVPDSTPLSDQDVQDMLDLNRLDVYQRLLTPGKSLTPSGDLAYYDFYAEGLPFWETDAILQNRNNGTVLTPDESNYMLGRWHFDTSQTIDIVLTGRVYNVYFAASKCAGRMLQSMRQDFDFTADGLTVQRIARINDLRAMVSDLASKGWSGMRTIKMVRKDERGDHYRWPSF